MRKRCGDKVRLPLIERVACVRAHTAHQLAGCHTNQTGYKVANSLCHSSLQLRGKGVRTSECLVQVLPCGVATLLLKSSYRNSRGRAIRDNESQSGHCETIETRTDTGGKRLETELRALVGGGRTPCQVQPVFAAYLSSICTFLRERFGSLPPTLSMLNLPLCLHRLSVLGPDEVRHGLRLAFVVVRAIAVRVNIMRAMPVPMSIVALRRANVLEFVDGAAFWAALNGSVAGGSEPDDNVGVRWAAGAADVLLVAEGLDYDRVLHCACCGESWGQYVYGR